MIDPELPRCPTIASVNAPSMNSTGQDCRGLRQQRRAGAGAERRLAAAAAERARHVPPLPCCSRMTISSTRQTST